jgi:hypothetical protein
MRESEREREDWQTSGIVPVQQSQSSGEFPLSHGGQSLCSVQILS